MSNISKETAAASATVGTDLISTERLNKTGFNRKINGIGLVGSAAVGDTEVQLFVGGVDQGKYRNTSTGLAVKADTDLKKLNLFVPANAQIEAKVTDAPATNPIVFNLEFTDYSTGNGGGRRTYRRSGGSYGGARRTGSTRRSGFYR